LGWKTAMVDPNMGTWSYDYDAAGNLVRQTDARNQTICFYYDELNRLTGKHYRTDTNCPTSDPSLNVSYTYDSTANGNKGIGRRTGMSDPSGSTSWVYDERGRVLTETKTINGTGGGTFTTRWSYDPMDRVETMTYPGGEVVNYTYNPQGLVEQIYRSSPTPTYYYVGATAYNALGQVTERWLGSTRGVLRQLYTYTAAENFRLTQLKSGTNPNYNNLQNISYTYDDVGNVLTITDAAAVGGSQTQTFTYDFLDRLVTAQASGGSGGTYGPENYTYNTIGNLMSKGGVSYGYNDPAHKHAVTHLGGVQKYWYDANGNQTKRVIGSDTYDLVYDAENRLTQVKKNGSVIASFVYDGDGKRVKATVNGVTTVYVGDYYEQTGSTGRKYYYANGQRIAMRVGGTLYWLLTDHLGSTAITANSSGSRVAELRYRAWGETRYTDGTTPTTYRFTGQRKDATIGLYFYNARYYDPALGRFISPDTLVPEPGNPQALNRYSYVLNNPLRFIDPSGHCEFDAQGNITRFDCSVEEFEKLPVELRIKWMRQLMQQWAELRLLGWFNSIVDILHFFQNEGLISPNSWISWGDAAILHAIQEGRNLFLGETTTSSNPGGAKWAAFFQARSRGAKDETLKQLWGEAEQTATNYGIQLANERATPPSPQQAAVFQVFVFFGDLYRGGVRGPYAGGLVGGGLWAGGGALVGFLACGPQCAVVGGGGGGVGGFVAGEWFTDPRSTVPFSERGPTYYAAHLI
jgi:RHS repeat-associated protein